MTTPLVMAAAHISRLWFCKSEDQRGSHRAETAWAGCIPSRRSGRSLFPAQSGCWWAQFLVAVEPGSPFPRRLWAEGRPCGPGPGAPRLTLSSCGPDALFPPSLSSLWRQLGNVLHLEGHFWTHVQHPRFSFSLAVCDLVWKVRSMFQGLGGSHHRGTTVLPSQKCSFDLGVLGIEEIFFSHLSFSVNKKISS